MTLAAAATTSAPALSLPSSSSSSSSPPPPRSSPPSSSSSHDHASSFFLVDFLAGGMSGAMTKTLSAPIERIKLLMQTQRANRDVMVPYQNSIDCMQRVYREQGIRSFWRGNVASVLRYFPSQAMNFAFKDRYQSWFPSSKKTTTSIWIVFASNLAAGGMAGGTALLASYPLDVVRTRMAADVRGGGGQQGRTRIETGVLSCIGHMWREGGVTSFYRGLSVALTGVVVFKALYMGGYDTCKMIFGLDNRESSIWGRLLTAQAITTTAGTLCYPFDTVKRRLMVQQQQLTPPAVASSDGGVRHHGGGSSSSTATVVATTSSPSLSSVKYRNGFHCVRTILREEGIRGLYSGLPANLVRGLSGSLLLVGYDEAKVLLQPLVAATSSYH